MITRFRVQNYKALRDVTLDLTPIHVLIGPNDSGKTSILEAIAALCRSVDHELMAAFTGLWEGTGLVWNHEGELPVSFEAILETDGSVVEYELSCRFADNGRRPTSYNERIIFAPDKLEWPNRGGLPHSNVLNLTQGKVPRKDDNTNNEVVWLVHVALKGVHFYRWNPRMLALPVAPDLNRRFRMESDGFGLALCLDDILGYDRDRFTALEKRFQSIFPDVKSIKLIPELAYRAPTDDPRQVSMLQNADGKGIYFDFAGRGLISASQVSDGVLLILAYLAVFYLPQPPRVLLVEEPENGIHPKRLKDILGILRNLVKEQSHTQVILTTHSPYVVDLFQPEEVTLCQKEGDGSVTVHRLSDSKTIREQADYFTLGEIWTGEGDEALAEPAAPDQEPAS
ncbi:MAG: AAA family ATPase [Phycisphaerae bacterium]|nr:AAA family ATPase [Phycisphaerae bacterium]